METLTVYHGSVNEIENFRSHVIYASVNRQDALQYAKMVDNGCGEFVADINSDGGFMYTTTISMDQVEIEEDFDCLDCGGYGSNIDNYSMPVVFNPESGYLFIKNAASLVWVAI